MTKALRIPNEYRFVRALAVAVDRGNSLNFLLEIGALLNRSLGIVRRVREALEPAYELASSRRDWDLVHTTSILLAALAEPDPAAYLAYRTAVHRQLADEGTDFAEAMAVVGCAYDYSLTTHRRPWEIESNDFRLSEWRERVGNLLFSMPGTALPKPAQPPAPSAPMVRPCSPQACLCSEDDSPAALAGNQATWCPAHQDEEEP